MNAEIHQTPLSWTGKERGLGEHAGRSGQSVLAVQATDRLKAEIRPLCLKADNETGKTGQFDKEIGPVPRWFGLIAAAELALS